MLILTRNIGETIVIGDNINVTVMGIKGIQVKIAIDAPKEVQAYRSEIFKIVNPEKYENLMDHVETNLKNHVAFIKFRKKRKLGEKNVASEN